MNWKEFKILCTKMREESDRLTKESGQQIWCEFHIHVGDDCLEINPYCPNLKTGIDRYVRSARTGKFLSYVNIKEELK